MPQKPESGRRSRISKAYFVASALVTVFAYGLAAGRLRLFPCDQIEGFLRQAKVAYDELSGQSFFFREMHDSQATSFNKHPETFKALRLITRTDQDLQHLIEIINLDFEVVHRWVADWDQLWPDAQHVPHYMQPRGAHGSHVHGAVVLPNGDVAFNFEHLGLICLDLDGNVRWRLEYRTHHSATLGPKGNIWVCGQKRVYETQSSYPEREPPYDEYTVLEVSPSGKLLNEYSVQGLLHFNGYHGVLPLSTLPETPSVRKLDDRLHLNDAEPFPAELQAGYFGPGDVAVSLRNPGIVFVFNVADQKIKYFQSGMTIRQHDPDFLDGDHLIVFDNHTVEIFGRKGRKGSSRIVKMPSDPHSACEVVYESGDGPPFYTKIMGKQQLLPNGNLLITESLQGRAFEVTPDNDIVWQYINQVKPGTIGIVTEASELPENVAEVFFNKEVASQ